ncbi:MAG TPA: outer-membrane lipoprotein carrier protein LolA [bacterium]|nr:outer-membrane lipoprotein carrier protein LolA [bacterium]
MKHIIVPLLLGLFASFADAAISANQVIERVQHHAVTDTPLRVSFQQIFEWKLTGNVEDVRGEMMLDGLDKFRITTPDQTIVSDGQTMWTYSRLENQVLIDNVQKDSQTLMPKDILFSYTQDYEAMVWQQDIRFNGEPALILRLLPRDEDKYIQETQVWVNTESWKPMQIQFTDINENETVYTINSIEEDPAISDTTFAFEPDTTMEVIDVR